MREGVQDEHFGLDEREYIKTRGGIVTFYIFFFCFSIFESELELFWDEHCGIMDAWEASGWQLYLEYSDTIYQLYLKRTCPRL